MRLDGTELSFSATGPPDWRVGYAVLDPRPSAPPKLTVEGTPAPEPWVLSGHPAPRSRLCRPLTASSRPSAAAEQAAKPAGRGWLVPPGHPRSPL